MKDILAFRMDDGMECFSLLAEMSYSSDQYPISSILIHEITTLAATVGDEIALANIICGILSEHWMRCLREELVPPTAPPHPLPTLTSRAVHPALPNPIPLKLSSPAKLRHMCPDSNGFPVAHSPCPNNNRPSCVKKNLQ